MAGGMRSGRGVPLRDRPVSMGDQREVPHRGGGQRHCWVQASPENPGPHAGLIQAWRHGPEGWSALVVYVVADDASDDVTTVQTWMPANNLRPA